MPNSKSKNASLEEHKTERVFCLRSVSLEGHSTEGALCLRGAKQMERFT